MTGVEKAVKLSALPGHDEVDPSSKRFNDAQQGIDA
jgi:hypothetical protein